MSARIPRLVTLFATLVLGAAIVAVAAGTLPIAQAAVPVYIRINFQKPASITPSGFLRDTGLTYRQQSNGLTYGWDQDVQDDARDRGSPISPNQSYDTLNHMQKNGNRRWDLQLANGTYNVRIVSGDPLYTDSRFHLLAEGAKVMDQSPNGNGIGHWVQGEAKITVNDGKLTITCGNNAQNNKINFIEISDSALPPVDQKSDNPPTPPYEQFELHVNFQPFEELWPDGYQQDDGQLYANRGNGFTYGWNATMGPIVRNNNKSPDARYDTLIPFDNEKWEVEVPKGSYVVHVVCGDPDDISGNRYRVDVENKRVVNGSPTTANPWVEGTITVTVNDGRLTLSSSGGARDNRICFVDITSAAITAFPSPGVNPTPPAAGAETNLMNAVKSMITSSVIFHQNGVTWFETVTGGNLIDPRAVYAETFRSIMTSNGTTENLFTTPKLLSSTVSVPDHSGGSPTKTLTVIIAVGSTGSMVVNATTLNSEAIVVAFGHNLTTSSNSTGVAGGNATVTTGSKQLGMAFGGSGRASTSTTGTGGNGGDALILGAGRGFAVGGKAGTGGKLGGNGGGATITSSRGGIAWAGNGGNGTATNSTGGNGGASYAINGPAVVTTPSGQGVSYCVGGTGGNGGSGASRGGAGGSCIWEGLDGVALGGFGGTGSVGGNGGWIQVTGDGSAGQAGFGGNSTVANGTGGRGGDANGYGKNVSVVGGDGGTATGSNSTGGAGGNATAFGSADNAPVPFLSITAVGGTGGNGARTGGRGGDAYALSNIGFAYASAGFGGTGATTGGNGGDATATAASGDALAVGGNGASNKGKGGAAKATAPNGDAEAYPGTNA
ncbi:MAG: hypothetical protein AB7K09_16390 [Planctomycetota bacterium]